MKILTGIIGATIAVWMTGCVSGNAFKLYPGPAKGQKEVTRLVAPPELEIGFCDGTRVTDPGLASAGTERELHFLPGLHFIDAKYVGYLLNEEGRLVKVESFSRLLEFHGKPGFCYKVLMPKVRNLAEARKYADSPVMDVQADMFSLRSYTKPRALQTGVTGSGAANVPMPPRAPQKPAVGGKPTTGPDRVVFLVPTPATSAVAKTKAVTVKPAATNSASAAESEALRSLKYLYNKASPADKAKFDKWRSGR